MSKKAHTPGPWVLNEVRTQCGRAFRIGSGEMVEAGKGCCIIYDDYPGDPNNERAANARLIAAAPDMLEALEPFVEVYEHFIGDDADEDQNRTISIPVKVFRRASVALSKATGGE